MKLNPEDLTVSSFETTGTQAVRAPVDTIILNPNDPTDIKTRPQGKVGPGWTVIIVGSVALGAGVVLLLVGLVGLWMQSIPVVG